VTEEANARMVTKWGNRKDTDKEKGTKASDHGHRQLKKKLMENGGGKERHVDIRGAMGEAHAKGPGELPWGTLRRGIGAKKAGENVGPGR